jgi:hypothetical protein
MPGNLVREDRNEITETVQLAICNVKSLWCRRLHGPTHIGGWRLFLCVFEDLDQPKKDRSSERSELRFTEIEIYLSSPSLVVPRVLSLSTAFLMPQRNFTGVRLLIIHESGAVGTSRCRFGPRFGSLGTKLSEQPDKAG